MTEVSLRFECIPTVSDADYRFKSKGWDINSGTRHDSGLSLPVAPKVYT